MRVNKVTNASLIIVLVVIVVALFGLSTVFAASRAGQVNLLAPQIDVQATARAIQVENRKLKLGTASQQRLAVIEAQIEQAHRTADDYNWLVATQTSRQHTQLADLQQQVANQQQTAKNLQATVEHLNNTITQTSDDDQLQLITLQTEFEQSEAELENELQTLSRQLATAEARIEAQPPAPITGATSLSAEDDHRDAGDKTQHTVDGSQKYGETDSSDDKSDNDGSSDDKNDDDDGSNDDKKDTGGDGKKDDDSDEDDD